MNVIIRRSWLLVRWPFLLMFTILRELWRYEVRLWCLRRALRR